MNANLSIQLENKVSVVHDCNTSLKKQSLSVEDADYTKKIQSQFLDEIRTLIATHPELSQHPSLLKLEPFNAIKRS